MQAAEFADQSMARAKIKMVGIGENDFGAESFERFLGESFDGGGGANGHESRRFDDAMGRGEKATPRASWIGMLDFERKTHFASVSGEDERPERTNDDKAAPDGENDDEGFCALEFSRVHGRKTDGDEDEHPDGKDIDGFAKGNEPFCGVIRKEGGEIGGYGIFDVHRAEGFEKYDE
jgi:hypothetical protein